MGRGAVNQWLGGFVWSDSQANGTTDNAQDQFVILAGGGFYVYTNTASTAKLSVSVDPTGHLISSLGMADQSKSVQAPTTGFSITIGNNVQTLILNPAGTLATGTITLPASPIDGHLVRICSSQIITALTVSPNTGQTITAAPTTLGLGGGFAYIYDLAGTNWYRLYNV